MASVAAWPTMPACAAGVCTVGGWLLATTGVPSATALRSTLPVPALRAQVSVSDWLADAAR